MFTRKIICLANSRKPPSGRCIAGKELDGPSDGQWIRPVSSRPSKEVSEEERRYETGSKAQKLDIIRVPLQSPSPVGHQSENYVLADDYYWAKEGKATWEQVQSLIDPYEANFWVQAASTFHGLNDKVSEILASSIHTSLKLIVPEDFEIRVLVEEGYEGRPSRRRVRGNFDYCGKTYRLSVTDPRVEDEYLAKDVGCYPIETVILCISLAEVWNGYAFRVVASVITPDQFEE